MICVCVYTHDVYVCVHVHVCICLLFVDQNIKMSGGGVLWFTCHCYITSPCCTNKYSFTNTHYIYSILNKSNLEGLYSKFQIMQVKKETLLGWAWVGHDCFQILLAQKTMQNNLFIYWSPMGSKEEKLGQTEISEHSIDSSRWGSAKGWPCQLWQLCITDHGGRPGFPERAKLSLR